MTILSVVAEDIDLLPGGGWFYSGSYRAAFVRAAIRCSQQSSTYPPNSYWVTSLWNGTASSFWLHFQLAASNATTLNYVWLSFIDSAGVARLLVRGTGVAGQVKLSTRNAAGTITDLATSAAGAIPNPGGINQLDFQVTYSASGAFTMYYNSVAVFTYSGNLTTDGGGQVFQQLLGSQAADYSGGGNYWSHSEIIVATTDTRAKSLFLATTSTAGTTQAFSGTATNVNQGTITDANYIFTTSAGQLQEYKPAALPPGVWNVDVVIQTARLLNGVTGPQKFDFVTRIATTEYLSADITLNNSFNNYTQYAATNPATSVAWTAADVAPTNLQYGIKSIT